MEHLNKSQHSYLFVPANRVERFDKALHTEADVVIIDLEDAVPIHLKNQAREELKQWLINHPEHQVMIRINSKQTEWFNDDVQLALLANVSAIVLPKTETANDVASVQNVKKIAVYPLVETPLGFSNIREIASAKNVQALMFGSIDFQLEMNMQGGYYELLSFRNEFVLASKLANICSPVDGVTVDFKDKALVTLETQQAKNLGFSGKLCIHPAQVDIVNQVFQPSPVEIEWANQVLEAVEQAQGQAVSLNGKMIDLPVISQAKKILAAAKH